MLRVSGMPGTQGIPGDGLRWLHGGACDHLIRIRNLVDSDRDLLTGAMDSHISTVSNRLNVVMRQLAIIAPLFLPLRFLTGFSGQNFAGSADRPLERGRPVDELDT